MTDYSITPTDETRPATTGASTQIAQSKSAQEVQAAVFMAKQFPRDENASYNRIMRACQRKRLAECAEYAYPRGGQTVTGPSIRLAEALAQNWGNIDYGIIELEQKDGESQVMAYCWDLETNTRQTKVFAVPHKRHTRTGSYKLDDPRDIYEMVANQGARRLRACILGVIPGDVVDDAVAQCNRTLAGESDEPLADRVKKMVTAFSGMGVTQPMIVERLGHTLDATTEQELVTLRKIYTSLRDGMAKPEQFFQRTATSSDGKKRGTDAVLDQIAKPKPAPEPEPPAEDSAEEGDPVTGDVVVAALWPKARAAKWTKAKLVDAIDNIGALATAADLGVSPDEMAAMTGLSLDELKD